MSPRELAWHITDSEGSFISESSVYRILKGFDLVTSPAYIVLSAADGFRHKTQGVHELWQTDFTSFKIVGWGWLLPVPGFGRLQPLYHRLEAHHDDGGR